MFLIGVQPLQDMIVTFYHKLVLHFLSMGEVSLLALVVELAIIKCEARSIRCVKSVLC